MSFGRLGFNYSSLGHLGGAESSAQLLPVISLDWIGKSANVELSGVNLTATASATQSNGNLSRSTFPLSTGNPYFEITVNASHVGAVGIGVISASQDITADNFLGGPGAVQSVGYYSDGSVYFDGSVIASLEAFTAGDIIRCLYDFDAHTMSFAINGGAFQTPVDFSSALTLPVPLYLGLDTEVLNDSLTVNFGDSSFTYLMPAGSIKWSQTVTGPFLPGDFISPAMVLAGTKCLVTPWSNSPCMDVFRASDSTITTINFINGALDVATLTSFLSGTVGQCSHLYDQSGSDNPLLTADVQYRPWVRIEADDVRLVFDPDTLTSKFLVFPTNLPFGTDLSMFCVGNYNDIARTYTMFELGTDSTDYAGMSNLGTNQLSINANSVTAATCSVQSGKNLHWMLSNSSGGTGGIGETIVPHNALFATVGSPFGGSLGDTRAFPDNGMQGQIEAFAIWPQVITPTQCVTLRKAFYTSFGIVTARDVVVFDGDSQTFAVHSTDQGGSAYGWTEQIQPMLSKPIRAYNYGISGQTMQTMAANYAANIAPLYDSTANSNTLFIFGGANDLAGRYPSLVLADMESEIAAAKATGFKVIACTLPYWPFSEFPTEATQADVDGYNASIRLLDVDGIADFNNAPIIGKDQSWTNTVYFNTDHEHYTGAGQAILATTAAAPLNALYV